MLNREQRKVTAEVKEIVAQLGMDLSDNAIQDLVTVIINMRKFSELVQKKIDSGMSQADAINWYIDQLSDTEKQKFMDETEVAGRFQLLISLHNAKNGTQ